MAKKTDSKAGLQSGQLWRKPGYASRLIIAVVNCYPFAGVRLVYAEIGPDHPWREVLSTPQAFRVWSQAEPAAYQAHDVGPSWRQAYRPRLTADGCVIDP